MDLSLVLNPLVNLIFAAVAVALATLVPVALQWLNNKTKLDRLVSDELVRKYLDQVIDRAIAFARSKVAEQKITVDVDNAIAAQVYMYLVKFVPDAIAYFGLDEAKVADMVRARLANVVKAPAPAKRS